MPIVNLDSPGVLAEEVASGRVWSGPGWAVKRAIEAINSGEVPMPAHIPEEFRGYITREDAPRDEPIEPDYTMGESPPADVNLPTPAEGPVDDEEALPPLGGEALA